uniref:2OG-FeII_Oxy_2 domain-containing protein n=1 Tax=Panagrellus redivivus TaxID=6233 RepID=A0A7E4VRM9_PANRE
MRLSVIRRAASELLYIHNASKWPKALLDDVASQCTVQPDFITESEEASLLKEIEPHMKRLRYEKAHWDDAIYLYREREQRRWKPENEVVLDRIRKASFKPGAAHLSYIHVLDLHPEGHIKPHIDSVRYCGDVITGVSILSDCVMRLRHKDDKDVLIADLLLNRRSLYKLTGLGRYEFMHEILADEVSFFRDTRISKGRRISIICRDIPQRETAPNELQYKPLENVET